MKNLSDLEKGTTGWDFFFQHERRRLGVSIVAAYYVVTTAKSTYMFKCHVIQRLRAIGRYRRLHPAGHVTPRNVIILEYEAELGYTSEKRNS